MLDVEKNLFIFECKTNFKDIYNLEKYSLVIRQASDELLDWFYDLESMNNYRKIGKILNLNLLMPALKTRFFILRIWRLEMECLFEKIGRYSNKKGLE